MATLKISYCQLIRIILSQIGGNPLQQVYAHLIQGMPSISTRSSLFSELSQIKQIVDEVTARIQQVVKDVNDYEKIARELAGQFLQNPMAASINSMLGVIDDKLLPFEEAGDTTSPDYLALIALKNKVQEYQDITNKLSGVTPPSGGQSCSLADLLGNGCTPAKDVPDIDLKILIQSLNRQNIFDALKTKILSGVGITSLQNEIQNLTTAIDTIATSFQNIFTKQFIKNAVIGYVNQIVSRLLSGCQTDTLSLSIKDNLGSTFSSSEGVFNLFTFGSQGSKSVTVSSVDNVIVGQIVTGANIALNSNVVSFYESNNTIILSRDLLGNNSNVELTFESTFNGNNFSIANALIEATTYIQNVYGNTTILSTGYVDEFGRSILYPNVTNTLSI